MKKPANKFVSQTPATFKSHTRVEQLPDHTFTPTGGDGGTAKAKLGEVNASVNDRLKRGY